MKRQCSYFVHILLLFNYSAKNQTQTSNLSIYEIHTTKPWLQFTTFQMQSLEKYVHRFSPKENSLKNSQMSLGVSQQSINNLLYQQFNEIPNQPRELLGINGSLFQNKENTNKILDSQRKLRRGSY
ncbi:hypothetical protein CIPAW_12G112000 [Carya illinoinensis]|uniref:Uncharacterized protein n=1 Tax=Carya illinoinensis TaxID=32201 RepID=A0A8T1NYF0_CARIL|nr:hypothetical protein CIPAW_12G112000 [Carya illinoinensis]